MNFYRQNLHFTDEEIEREMQDALEHFNTRFGLNFSAVESNERGQRIIGILFPILPIQHNSWKSSETHLEPIPISGGCKVGCVTKVPFLLDVFTIYNSSLQPLDGERKNNNQMLSGGNWWFSGGFHWRDIYDGARGVFMVVRMDYTSCTP